MDQAVNLTQPSMFSSLANELLDAYMAEMLAAKGWRVVKLERVGPRRPMAEEDTRPYRITEELR